MIFITFFKCH